MPIPQGSGSRMLEWAGSDLGTVFAQKRNLVSPRFLGMLADVTRFYREAPQDLAELAHQPHHVRRRHRR